MNKIILILLCGIYFLSWQIQIAFGQTPELYLQTGHISEIRDLDFSPDGRILASSGNEIKLWNLETGLELRTILSSKKHLYITFSADGKKLASIEKSDPLSEKKDIFQLWDIASGGELKKIDIDLEKNKLGAAEAGDFILTSDEKVIIPYFGNVYSDGSFIILDIKTGEIIKTSQLNMFVTGVQLSPDETVLIINGFDRKNKQEDRKVTLWNLRSGKEISSFNSSYIGSSTVSDDKHLMAFSCEKEIRIYETKNWNLLKMITKQELSDSFLLFSEGGKTLEALNYEYKKDERGWIDGNTGKYSFTKWNVETGAAIESYPTEDLKISPSSLVVSPDRKLFAKSSDNFRHIEIWKTEGFKKIKTFGGNVDFISALSVSKKGDKVAFANQNTNVKIWNTLTGEVAYFADTERLGNALDFTPDDKILAAAGNSKVKMWSVETGQIVYEEFPGYLKIINKLKFSQDGKHLAVGSGEAVVLVSVSNGEVIGKFKFGPSSGVTFLEKLAFSIDGAKLLAEGFNLTSGINILKVWDVATKEELSLPLTEIQRTQTNLDTNNIQNKFIKPVKEGAKINLVRIDNNRLIASLIGISEKDWLIITPEGFFDGTPNAWKQLIWRFDNNTFSYAPIEAFFKEFYYPGLLQEIMQGKTPPPPAKDLTKIDIRQPFIKISAIDGKAVDSSAVLPDEVSAEKKSIKVKVEITDNISEPRSGISKNTSSDARDVRLFRNGSLVKLWKDNAFKLTEKDGCKQFPASGNTARRAVCETDVQITSGRNELTVYGFNRENVKSSDNTAFVNGAESLKRDGTLYILAVGVNEYANRAFNLKYAVPDVEAIGKELTIQQSKLSAKPYAETKVITLTDKQATKANFVNALKRFSGTNNQSGAVNAELEKIKPIQPEDALIIYFAGHGLASKDRFYLIPHDGIPLNFSKSITDSSEQQRLLTQGQSLSDQSGLEQLFKQSISDLELEDLLETVNAGKLMMVIDACNSGQALEAEEKRRGPMNSRGLAQLAYEKGMNILTASQSFQAAIEASSLNHGLLTYALLEGLKQGDKNNDRMIIDREWLDFGVVNVPRLQVEARNKRLLTQNKPTNTANNDANLQTPRVFYRRESDSSPLVIALPR